MVNGSHWLTILVHLGYMMLFTIGMTVSFVYAICTSDSEDGVDLQKSKFKSIAYHIFVWILIALMVLFSVLIVLEFFTVGYWCFHWLIYILVL